MFTPIILIICSVLLGFFSCLFLTAAIQKSRASQKKKEQETIRQLQHKISLALQDKRSEQHGAFTKVLDQAAAPSAFQATGMQVQVKSHREPPEKYKILQRLATQGLSTEEIAAILGISTVEADQLINLYRMADCRN